MAYKDFKLDFDNLFALINLYHDLTEKPIDVAALALTFERSMDEVQANMDRVKEHGNSIKHLNSFVTNVYTDTAFEALFQYSSSCQMKLDAGYVSTALHITKQHAFNKINEAEGAAREKEQKCAKPKAQKSGRLDKQQTIKRANASRQNTLAQPTMKSEAPKQKRPYSRKTATDSVTTAKNGKRRKITGLLSPPSPIRQTDPDDRDDEATPMHDQAQHRSVSRMARPLPRDMGPFSNGHVTAAEKELASGTRPSQFDVPTPMFTYAADRGMHGFPMMHKVRPIYCAPFGGMSREVYYNDHIPTFSGRFGDYIGANSNVSGSQSAFGFPPAIRDFHPGLLSHSGIQNNDYNSTTVAFSDGTHGFDLTNTLDIPAAPNVDAVHPVEDEDFASGHSQDEVVPMEDRNDPSQLPIFGADQKTLAEAQHVLGQETLDLEEASAAFLPEVPTSETSRADMEDSGNLFNSSGAFQDLERDVMAGQSAEALEFDATIDNPTTFDDFLAWPSWE